MLDSDGMNCRAVDMCAVANGGCSHECYTTYGKSFCMCPAGYKLDEDWKTCVDVDECATMSAVREECNGGSKCENTPGSYRSVRVRALKSSQVRQYLSVIQLLL